MVSATGVECRKRIKIGASKLEFENWFETGADVPLENSMQSDEIILEITQFSQLESETFKIIWDSPATLSEESKSSFPNLPA
jgi:hypothetical protein